MKKFLVVLCTLLILTGCGKKSEDVIKEFENKVNSLENYHLIGEMQIANNEDKYNYEVDVTYKKGNYYKVSLINKENKHEQVILKNEEGVFIVTPSINKSFKFQSEWPTNSSQSYILEAILKDISNDADRSVSINKDKYTIISKVNYPNNSDLKNEEITLGSDYLPTKVVVKNSSGTVMISTVISKIDVKTKYDKNYFALSSSIKESSTDKPTSSTLDSVIYPMYLPSGTKYSTEEVITKDDSERVILSYTGSKPFILIEEASTNKEHETTLVSGEVVQYGNILGVMTNTSLNWSNNGKEYYIIGESLSSNEMLEIASSTSTVALTK